MQASIWRNRLFIIIIILDLGGFFMVVVNLFFFFLPGWVCLGLAAFGCQPNGRQEIQE